MVDRGVREFEGIRIETLDWPIVTIDFPPGRVQDASLRAALGHLETLMRDAISAHEKMFTLTDLTRMRQITPASQRKLTGEWIQRTAGLARASCVASAQVTPSALLRGIITAVYWFHPPPTPSFFAATRAEAVRRAVEMLRAANVQLPPRFVDMQKTNTSRG
jgi:hypothetical protein